MSAGWHDYRDCDVAIAFRPPPRRKHERRGYTAKPATKLYNAWHAGVPAILGPEYAYRELRRTDLDYLEITNPGEARGAIRTLRENAVLYSAMVENGRERAREFTVDRILARWAEVLFDQIPERAAQRRVARVFSHSWRAGGRWIRRAVTAQPGR